MLTLIQNGGLAALIAQMSFSPRDMESFERAVLTAHEDPNLSQDEIAGRAGVPRQTLSRWMSDAPEVFAPPPSSQANCRRQTGRVQFGRLLGNSVPTPSRFGPDQSRGEGRRALSY